MNKTMHDQLVQFLQDHDDPELFGEPTIYENVVMTKRELIKIMGHGTRIDSFVKIEGGEGVYIGRGVHIASFAHIGIGGGKTFIGDFAAVASHAMIISGSNQVDALSMSATAPLDMQRRRSAETRLENYACVLAGGIVCPGVTLREGAVLGAGSVATHDIPEWELWIGAPARFARKRNP